MSESERVATGRLMDDFHPPDGLTMKEWACLVGVADLKKTAEIAHDIGLKPKTVDAYCSNAARKLGANDRYTAVRILQERHPELWGKSPSAIPRVDEAPADVMEPSPSRPVRPWPTRARPVNDLSFGMKLLLVAAIAAGMMLAVAAYIAAVVAINAVL